MSESAREPQIFGRSVEVRNGDLHLAAGDLSLVEAQENLRQGLAATIETALGSDIFNTTYGFDFEGSVVRPQGLRLKKQLIRLHLSRALSQDDRVREVVEVAFDDEQRFFQLVPEANPEEARTTHKSSRRWRAAIRLATVPDGEIRLALEGPTL